MISNLFELYKKKSNNFPKFLDQNSGSDIPCRRSVLEINLYIILQPIQNVDDKT